MFDALYPPGQHWYWKADFVKELSDEAIALHVKHGSDLADAGSRRCTCIRSTAAAREGENSATAWGYREARWAEVIVGVDPDPGKQGDDRQVGARLLGTRSTRTPPAART